MPAKKKTTVTKRKPRPTTKAEGSLDFTALVDSIRQVHEQSAALVNRTVNTTLTLRNWVIGAYIREYEPNGSIPPPLSAVRCGLSGDLADTVRQIASRR